MYSKKQEQAFISEDRKVKLISDVDSFVPEKLKKLISLIEEIIETDENTLLSVYEKIEKSEESINSVYQVIKYAFNIRPINTTHLLSLFCLLAQKHGYKNTELIGKQYSMFLNQGIICKRNSKENIPQEDKNFMIFKQDDLESFIKKSSEIGFNPKLKFEADLDSPISYMKKINVLSFLQIMAFYGAVKCFKYASLNNEYDFADVEKFAVAGGNMEIIHILEQRNISFEKCLEVSIKFHRNELSDWILIHYKCLESSLSESCSYFNYRAVVFGFMNEINISGALSLASLRGHLEVVKYLYEKCHANVKTKDKYERTPINNASMNGRLEVVKYLYETCHTKITKETIEKAKTEEIKKYLRSKQ